MEFLIDCGLFLLGLIVGNYAYIMVFFPLFYGLPKSLWLVTKRELKWWTPLLFLLFPLAFGGTLIFVVFFLDIFEMIATSFAYGLALHLMVGFALIRWAFSQKEKAKIRSAFERFVASNRLDIERVFQ
jgi:hypothetical protein